MRKHDGFIFLLGIGMAFSSGAVAAVEKPTTPLVFTEKVKSTELFDTLTYPARLIPKINATVLSEAEGIIGSILTPLGKMVGRRQKMMVITQTDPVYHYVPMAVMAPVAGVISSVEVTEGSRVTKGARLATITDPSQIRIVVEVAVSDLAAIQNGLSGQLRTVAGDEAVPVKVVGVSPFVDPATGTATAELVLDGKPSASSRLPPGLVGRVTFHARDHRGIQIPESAIVYRGSEPAVRIVEKGKAKFQPIQLGQTRRGLIETVGGLKEGMEVVVRASSYIADGDAVTVENMENEGIKKSE